MKETMLKTIFVVLLLLNITSCQKNNLETMVATTFEVLSGGDQEANAGEQLANPIIVMVKDQKGNAFEGAIIKFSLVEGSVSSPTATTDANGKASVLWTLGSSEGIQKLTVTAFKEDGITTVMDLPIIVHSYANIVATKIIILSGNQQEAMIGTTLTNKIEVIVKDQNENEFIGATVNFTVVEGSVSDVSTLTGEDGKASVTWTLGATQGNQTLTITAYKKDGITALTGSPITVNAKAGGMIDYDNNIYFTVTIGNQVWMAENLKTTHYEDGTPIPLITDNIEWSNLGNNNIDKGYCYYNNDESNGPGKYGALYTWAAAMNGENSSNENPSGIKGICPTGWHLPSDEEWIELEMHLGMSRTEAEQLGLRGTNEGGKLKEIGTSYWSAPNTGATNESGFSALPGGNRYTDGQFYTSLAGIYGYWWTTQSGIYRNLNKNYAEIGRYSNTAIKSNGYSVRCINN